MRRPVYEWPTFPAGWVGLALAVLSAVLALFMALGLVPR